MAQKRKLPFLLRILLPPVLALAVLWGGSFCANALLDSQGGPKAGLWGLIQHLPRNVQIEKIWFSYNAVSFSVSTDSPQQLMVLLEYLQSSEQYSTVFFYPDSQSSSPYAGEFCCYF